MMELTRKGEYAIRGILYLASRPQGKVALISEIAESAEVPKSFLAKIFQSFAKVGLVSSFRGTGGGFVLAVGTMVRPALLAAEMLAGEDLQLSVVNARFVKPLDRELILSLAAKTGVLVTVEENVLQGGFGTAVLELLEEEGLDGVRVLRLGFPDTYIEQGEQAELRAMYGLDAAGIVKAIRELMMNGK